MAALQGYIAWHLDLGLRLLPGGCSANSIHPVDLLGGSIVQSPYLAVLDCRHLETAL